MSLRLAKMSSAPTKGLLGVVVAISVGATFFLLPALINGFPFVFPDSEDYLVFTPMPHSLFIFFFHLNHLIWVPILVQAVIASHLIWVYFCWPRRLFVFLPVYSSAFTLCLACQFLLVT